ncbi:FIMAH domain-containing protein [Paenibacillus senegalensis]|uniref:FIMAH domain-containing protein n=1 Tax=Paenibacillus senegalensis TaxID=1465766 RepID=UPI0002884A7C|nr:family 10 glycosylhydrolase [Paenibacillus senegalensis]
MRRIVKSLMLGCMLLVLLPAAVWGMEAEPELRVDQSPTTTVFAEQFLVSGQVEPFDPEQEYSVTVNGVQIDLREDGSFEHEVVLTEGMNELLVTLRTAAATIDSQLLMVNYVIPAENEDYIEVEAAPVDITIIVEGPRMQINHIDTNLEGTTNFLALYTTEYGSRITVPRTAVAVQIDSQNRVLTVVNPSVNGNPPNWTGPTDLDIPEGGFVLFANDDSWANRPYKQYLAKNFKVGDVIKLRKNGEVIPVTELMTGTGPRARLNLNPDTFTTVIEPVMEVSGTVDNREEGQSYTVMLNDQLTAVQPDGTFQAAYPVQPGVNYIDVELSKNGEEQDVKSLVVYYKSEQEDEKKIFLWVDQGANAIKFQTSDSVRDMLEKARDAGITDVVLDVKGVEGFASYKRNDLTGRPYISEMTSPTRAGSNPDLDLLELFIEHGHDLGLKIHAAFNVFAEGSIAHNEFGVLNDHLDWEEQIYRAEDNGQILRLRESAYGKSGALVVFVNPANDEVRDYQLRGFEEVIKNYNVDGVLLDRGRYDNYFADFSDVSRAKFEDFLAERGKELVNWPEDVFTYNANGTRVDGPLILEWWEFRSAVIKSFTAEVKELVDRYERETGREILTSAYVGSWFDTYYLNGVHWGSTEFRYDPRLGFTDEDVYTDGYYETGYAENLDFLQIGTYQTTASEIKKYITIGNIVTNGELPLYSSMAMNNVQEPVLQREVFQAGLRNSSGLMLFDYSQVNWPIVKASINDYEYVKDYQVGISIPGHPDEFREADFYNANRNEDNLNVYTNAFGLTTGGNSYGVEAVVDASGKVTHVANKTQAINWNWNNRENNNSVIPQGGIVISAMDASGVRERRQFVARTYSVGDDVRSAVLRGYLDYAGRVVHSSELVLEGSVEVLGTGKAEVRFNGEAAEVAANGDYSGTISLTPGANDIEIAVYVDGIRTNAVTVTVTYEEEPGQQPATVEERIAYHAEAGDLNPVLADQLNYRMMIIRLLIEQQQIDTAITYLDDFIRYISDPSVRQQGLIADSAHGALVEAAEQLIDELQD